MSLLNSNQRAVVAVDTKIDRLLIDRTVEAFDALIERDDVETCKQLLAHAWAQMGFGLEHPIKASDRPTALDKIKTICIKAYADREGITFKAAAARLTKMLAGT